MPRPGTIPPPVKSPVVYDLVATFPGLAPGSAPARSAGCSCPTRANRHGCGAPSSAWGEKPPARSLWLVERGCPLHRPAPGT